MQNVVIVSSLKGNGSSYASSSCLFGSPQRHSFGKIDKHINVWKTKNANTDRVSAYQLGHIPQISTEKLFTYLIIGN